MEGISVINGRIRKSTWQNPGGLAVQIWCGRGGLWEKSSSIKATSASFYIWTSYVGPPTLKKKKKKKKLFIN